jgi:hypothetical protein
MAQGNAQDALTAYRDCAAIRERLVAANPNNNTWQLDLAGAYGKLGLAYGSANDRDNALEAFRKGQAVMDRLLTLIPDNDGLKQEQAWFANQVAALTK